MEPLREFDTWAQLWHSAHYTNTSRAPARCALRCHRSCYGGKQNRDERDGSPKDFVSSLVMIGDSLRRYRGPVRFVPNTRMADTGTAPAAEKRFCNCSSTEEAISVRYLSQIHGCEMLRGTERPHHPSVDRRPAKTRAPRRPPDGDHIRRLMTGSKKRAVGTEERDGRSSWPNK